MRSLVQASLFSSPNRNKTIPPIAKCQREFKILVEIQPFGRWTASHETLGGSLSSGSTDSATGAMTAPCAKHVRHCSERDQVPNTLNIPHSLFTKCSEEWGPCASRASEIKRPCSPPPPYIIVLGYFREYTSVEIARLLVRR
jgi:hypothetical protein